METVNKFGVPAFQGLQGKVFSGWEFLVCSFRIQTFGNLERDLDGPTVPHYGPPLQGWKRQWDFNMGGPMDTGRWQVQNHYALSVSLGVPLCSIGLNRPNHSKLEPRDYFSTFMGGYRTRILQIPVGAATSQDRLVWHFFKNGAFSVSSCYHMIFSTSDPMSVSAVSCPGDGSGSSTINWNLIWKMKVPPKIRMFLWRATIDNLPHNAELFRRKVVASPFCSRCSRCEETSMHIFRECRGMNEVWESPPFNLSHFESRMSFWAWLHVLRKECDQATFLLAMIVLWRAWETRNREIHNSHEFESADIVTWST